MKSSKLLFATLMASLLITACGSSSQGDTSDSEEKEEETPVVDLTTQSVKYGIYPQSVVTDGETIAKLEELDTNKQVESNGWYLLDETYYAKINKASPFKITNALNEGETEDEPDPNCYYFLNGQRIVTDAKYWFKCEPINWKIYKTEENGEHYVISEFLLDTRTYHISATTRTIGGEKIYANNYKESDMRKWLNDGFLNTAFCKGYKHAKEVAVDNSAASTGIKESDENPYACADTTDRVYLPSYADYTNIELDTFTNNPNPNEHRSAIPTDYARAKGAFYSQDADYSKALDKGLYWTRSPYNLYGNVVSYVAPDGSIRNDIADELSGEDLLPKADYVSSYIDRSYLCVRPAITVKM